MATSCLALALWPWRLSCLAPLGLGHLAFLAFLTSLDLTTKAKLITKLAADMSDNVHKARGRPDRWSRYDGYKHESTDTQRVTGTNDKDMLQEE